MMNLEEIRRKRDYFLNPINKDLDEKGMNGMENGMYSLQSFNKFITYKSSQGDREIQEENWKCDLLI